jgi:hypothetical protein
VTIHVPGEDLGRPEAEKEPEAPAEAEAPAAAESDEAPKPKKKTRRGSRGGKNRKKKPATAATNGASPDSDESGEVLTEPGRAPAASPPEHAATDWDYVPMSEWADEIERNR